MQLTVSFAECPEVRVPSSVFLSKKIHFGAVVVEEVGAQNMDRPRAREALFRRR